MYKTDRSASNTLTSGDRAGSRYYDVLENTTLDRDARTRGRGAIQSGMKNMVTAFVVNPFVKVGGAEFFGNVETMTGAARDRAAAPHAPPARRAKALYRFAERQALRRRPVQHGERASSPGIANDITVKRTQVGGGWFVTPNVLSKIEFVQPEVRRLPHDRHPQRRQVQGLHDRGRRRLLTQLHNGERRAAMPGLRGVLRFVTSTTESPMTQSNLYADRAKVAVPTAPAGAVVVALKPFAGGDSSIAMGRWLAERRATQLHVMGVVEMGDAGTLVAGLPPLSSEYYARERDEIATDLRARVALHAGRMPVRVDVVEGAPGSTVAQAAVDREASMVVVGTGRHAMLDRFLYGERALELVRSARSPVLVVPPDAEPTFTRAIVGVDFSRASVRAATVALEMLDAGSHLTLVHVARTAHHPDSQRPGEGEETEGGSRRSLARLVDALPKSSARVDTVILHGDAVGALLEYAEAQDAKLIACGRGRHSLMHRLRVGSVSTAIVRGATCCVLVIPQCPQDEEPDLSLVVGEASTSAEPNEWRDLLREVSERNAGRPARLSLAATSPEGATSVDRGYQLLAVEYDRRGGGADIVLGDPHVMGSHLTHRITGIRHIETVTEPDGRATRIAFTSQSGDCVLDFVDS